MKYLVELKFTNPAHEHISLRRRVNTITRLVEASSESEAINRVSNQHRALGFMIREAAVVKRKSNEKENGEVTIVAAGKNIMKKAKKADDEEEDKAEAIEEKNGTASYPLLKKGEKLKPMKLKEEEVELDEAQKKLRPSYWKAEWRLGTQSEVDKNNKKIFDKLAKTDPVKASAFHDNLMRMKKKDVKEEVEQVDEVKAVKAYDKEGKLVGRYRSMDHAKQMKPGHTYKVEEGVQQVDEANMRFDPEAAARPKSSDVKNFLNRDKNPRAAAASKKYIRRMTKLGGLGPNQTKKDTEAHMKAHFEEVVTEASKEGKDVMRGMRASLKSMDLRHGVDADKRVSGYKMSPAVKAAQAKSDALSKVVKRPQAGTLSAQKNSIKKIKLAQKAVDVAKGVKNKINMQPEVKFDAKV